MDLNFNEFQKIHIIGENVVEGFTNKIYIYLISCFVTISDMFK